MNDRGIRVSKSACLIPVPRRHGKLQLQCRGVTLVCIFCSASYFLEPRLAVPGMQMSIYVLFLEFFLGYHHLGESG